MTHGFGQTKLHQLKHLVAASEGDLDLHSRPLDLRLGL
jgi:hypothetical protein